MSNGHAVQSMLKLMLDQLNVQKKAQEQAVKEADKKALAAEAASTKQCDALQTGLRHMARGMTSVSFMKDIKICGYEATGLQRVAFIKKCEGRRSGDDYDEAWTSIKTRSTDTPVMCKTLAETSIQNHGNVTAATFRQIAREFIFRKRAKTADDVAEESVELMSSYGPVKGQKIHEYYGVAQRAWGGVIYAYDLETEGTKPARATRDGFFRAWTENLASNVRRHVRLQRMQARSIDAEDSFTLEKAYNHAQDYMDCDGDNGETQYVSKDMLKRANLLAIINKTYTQDPKPKTKKRCRYFAKGHCNKGDNCDFSHENKKRKRDDDDGGKANTRRSKKDDTCKRCGSEDHQYSPVCPEYQGCRRCNSKEHMLKTCTEKCAKCNANAGEDCKKDCQARSAKSFRH